MVLFFGAFIKGYLSSGGSPVAAGRGVSRGENTEALNTDSSLKSVGCERKVRTSTLAS